MQKWELVGDVLTLRLSDTEVLVPSAREIFQIVFKGSDSVRGLRVTADLPAIQFSKFPINLKIVLCPIYISDTCELFANVVAYNRNENLQDIIFNSETPDHLVIDNMWYPFAPGEMESISEIFMRAFIHSSGRITLKQYLAFKNCIGPDSYVTDEISDGIKHYFKNASYIDGSGEEIPAFSGKLYPYQQNGVKWLKMITREDAGCILGDQMGLGKTIQIIALLALEKSEFRKPSLVVMPPTLMENWRREILKFAPEISYLVHKGFNRTGFHSKLSTFDIVIASYETVLNDLSMFKMIGWNLIVLDEAHSIKNPNAKRTIALKQLKRRAAVAVTGTPIQNRLVDLWSVVDFVLPGYLGNLRTFENMYVDNVKSAERLEELISPVLLRRLVSEVAGDLPERIDVPQAMEMTGVEAIEYEDVRLKIVEEYGKSATLVSISKLRMFCTHPFLINDEDGDPAKVSTKYQRLVEILQEIFDSDEKVLIFTSYSKMVDIILKDLSFRYGKYCSRIDGRVKIDERQGIIDSFEKIAGGAALVLNPRAAGVGLNITAANHVIHYNLEWNPAVEDQASARAYRRGQKKPVTVHRLYYADTVEEIIDMRIDKKRMLFESAVVGHDGSQEGYDDIVRAINMSPIKG